MSQKCFRMKELIVSFEQLINESGFKENNRFLIFINQTSADKRKDHEDTFIN